MSRIVAASKVLIVGGKGGVGKTTVGATVAIAAAQEGADVLLVELGVQARLGPLLGQESLRYQAIPIKVDVGRSGGRVRARRIQPDEALSEYLDEAGLGPLIRRLTRSGAIEVVSTTAPGIRDLVVLGKIRQLEEQGAAELIIVDAPATGHALSLLTSPAGLAASAEGGPVNDQAAQVLAMFADDRRCQMMLVTLPEETPVNETVEAAFALEDQVGIKLAPVVVNGLWPEVPGLAEAITQAENDSAPETARDLVPRPAPFQDVHLDVALEAGRYRLHRLAAQRRQLDRLAEELPLPQIHLPQRFSPALGLDDLQALADQLSQQLHLVVMP